MEYDYYSTAQYRDFVPWKLCFPAPFAGSLNRWYWVISIAVLVEKKAARTMKERALVCQLLEDSIPKDLSGSYSYRCSGDRLLLTKYAGRSFKSMR